MDHLDELALLKFRLIAPVLNGTETSHKDYFRRIAAQPYQLMNREGDLRFKVGTFKKWLQRYRKFGFPGLECRARMDKGKARVIDYEQEEQILEVLRKFEFRTVQGLYDFLVDSGILAQEGCTYATLRNFVRRGDLFHPADAGPERKSFTKPFVNMLWVGDIMYGPHAQGGPRGTRSYLFTLLDDHSRFPVGCAFEITQDSLFVERVLKRAISTYGVPNKVYLDNGKVFVGEDMCLAGAKLGFTVVHSKPGDPESRGKIERYFRTVRDRFLDRYLKTLGGERPTLEALNEALRTWLAEDYLHKIHSTIKDTPHAHFFTGVTQVTIRKKTPEEIRTAFLHVLTRKVSGDALVSIDNVDYEVPGRCIGKTVKLHFDPAAPDLYYLLGEDGEAPVIVKPVDRYGNAEAGIRFA